MVGIIGKKNEHDFRKEKNKSSKSVFYQLYGYELFTDFSSMSKHAENRFSLKSDDNHVFRINNAEKYCKNTCKYIIYMLKYSRLRVFL